VNMRHGGVCGYRLALVLLTVAICLERHPYRKTGLYVLWGALYPPHVFAWSFVKIIIAQSAGLCLSRLC
jgi:hypothetical protein